MPRPTIVNKDRPRWPAARQDGRLNCLNPTGALPATQARSGCSNHQHQSSPRRNGRATRQHARLIMNPAFNAASVGGFAGLFNSQAKLGRQYDSGLMVDSARPVIPRWTRTSPCITAPRLRPTSTAPARPGHRSRLLRWPAVRSRPGRSSCPWRLRSIPQVSGQHRCSGAVRRHGGHGGSVHDRSPISGNRHVWRMPERHGVATGGSPYVIVGHVDLPAPQRPGSMRTHSPTTMVPMAALGRHRCTASRRFRTTTTRSKVTDFYDGTNDNVITRLDVLFGWAATYPELYAKYYTV